MRSPGTITLAILLSASIACAGLVTSEPLPPPPPALPLLPPLPGTAEAAGVEGVGGAEPRVGAGSEGCDPCSLLMLHGFDALQGGKACELCGEADPATCDEWPSASTPCATYDEYRNCIYARLGYDFETAPAWKEVFSEASWYSPDPAFTWGRVTPVQKRNAQALRDVVRRKRCVR